MAAIETRGLSKRYGRVGRGARARRPVDRGRRGRDLRLPRAQRRRQEHDDPAAARLPPPDGRRGRRPRPRHRARLGRDPAARRLPAGRHRVLGRPDRRATARRARRALRAGRRSAAPSWPSGSSCRPRRSAARCATTRAACARSSASSRRSSTTRSWPILDEPTEGLDPLMQRAFYEILDELRAAGRTIFFSSHVLSEVERVCDRVAIVRAGRLVALEEVPALLARRKRERRDAPRRPAAGARGRRRRHATCGSADGRLTCRLEGDVGPFLAAIAGAPIARPDHRAGAPRGGVPRVLRARGRAGRRRSRRRRA